MTDEESISIQSVLLIDDEPDNVEVIVDTLEFMGITVQSAPNGAEGLTLLESFTPDLILLDLSMPVMDGWETRKRLKANEKTQHIPVVALTAHAMAGDEERAVNAGFDGYVSKPVNVGTFMDDVRATLKKHQNTQGTIDSQKHPPESSS